MHIDGEQPQCVKIKNSDLRDSIKSIKSIKSAQILDIP